jgi:hypothetical protein
MAETKTSIHSKLLEFQKNIEVIKKDGKNTFFKKPDGKPSTYATLGNILSEVKPLLNELGLVVTQPVTDGIVSTIITDSESNEAVVSSIKLPEGLDAQKMGSAITYFRRYTLTSLLALELEEDDDGNKASEKVPEKKMTVEQAFVELRKAVNLDVLKQTFTSLPPAIQKDVEVIALKDELKAALTI